MPEISRFFGIVIAIYYNDHSPAHFMPCMAKIEIASGRVLSGNLPRRAFGLVDEWRKLHVNELLADWRLAMVRKPLNRIEPLE